MTNNRLAERVKAMTARLHKEDVNMHGFVLTVDGREKVKAYYAPFREGMPHRLYSVSKTMTGIAIGMLIADRKLHLDDCICTFFEEWLPPQPSRWLLSLTIQDMLRMATCYRRTAYREGADENWALPFFTAVPDHAPGEVFNYDTGCSQVLAALVKRLSGLEVIDFLDERLFAPLGCQDRRYWLRDPSGCCQGGTGLCMSLRDLHRVALCVLRGGDGLIPWEYTQAMGKKHIETLLQANEEERYGYGWQCWRTRAGFAMYGLGGQLTMICPEKNTVFSTIADTRLDPVGVQRIYNAFFEEVYPYIGTEDMAPVSLELETHALQDCPTFAMAESPRYVFPDDNPLHLRSLKLKGNCLYYENGRGQAELTFGRGKNLQIPYPGWPQVPALASGGWAEDGLLRIRCYAVGNAPCGFDMLLQFHSGRVTVQARKSYDPITEGYDGTATGVLCNEQE